MDFKNDENQVYIEDEDIWVDEETAENEYYQCEDCGRWFSRRGVYTDGSDTVCDSCFDANGWQMCDDCGCLIRRDDVYWSDGYCYCESCYYNNDHEYCAAYVHDYDYKPQPIFHAAEGETDELYMGVELETDTDGWDRGACSEDLKNLDYNEHLFYQKSDCSLNNGIEIVTHPCTLKYHMEKFPWDKISFTSLENNFRSHHTDTCGLHVHVSRMALGDNGYERDLTSAKLVLLMDKFWNEITKFARRRETQWAAKPDANIVPEDTDDDAIDKMAHQERSRYRAVNLCNSETVEFRIFKGTLKVNTIKATLQFVHNMVYFAKSNSLQKIQQSTWRDLVYYERYEELDQYLAERNLTPQDCSDSIAA